MVSLPPTSRLLLLPFLLWLTGSPSVTATSSLRTQPGGGCSLLSLPLHPLLVYTHLGRTVPQQSLPSLVVPDGETLEARCRQPGLYLQLGGGAYNCSQGAWLGNVTCIDTNHIANYTTGHGAPAIVWHVAPGGVTEVAGNGHIALLPGVILHMDCLFPRLAGNPSWTWTPEYRRYPTGWSISSAERELHYRLSVYYAKDHDSGTFTCTTPSGDTNSITLMVKGVSCPELDIPRSISDADLYQESYGDHTPSGGAGDSRVIVYGSGNDLGAVRHFKCFQGYYLAGSEAHKCLPSGVWSSAHVPSCVTVRCPLLPSLPPLVRLQHLSLSAGGSAVFSCPQGYTLFGNSTLFCRTNATWSDNLPLCNEVLCPPPGRPLHGSVSAPALRRVGDVSVYSCSLNYVLRGPRQLVCASDGNWNRTPPDCVVSCLSPGKPINGRVSPRLPRYSLAAELLVSCAPGYRPAGPDRLQCLKTGRWSSPLPPCVPSLSG